MPRCQNKAWHAKTRPSKSRTKPETLLKGRVDTNPHRCPAKESPVARIGSTCKRPTKSYKKATRGAARRSARRSLGTGHVRSRKTVSLKPRLCTPKRFPAAPYPRVSPNLAFTRLTCLGKLFPNTTDNVKIVRKTQHRQLVMQNHAQKPCKTEFTEKQTKTCFFRKWRPSSRLSQGRPIGKGPASKTSFALGEVQTSPKGAIVWQSAWTHVLWEPSSLGEDQGPRQNACLAMERDSEA